MLPYTPRPLTSSLKKRIKMKSKRKYNVASFPWWWWIFCQLDQDMGQTCISSWTSLLSSGPHLDDSLGFPTQQAPNVTHQLPASFILHTWMASLPVFPPAYPSNLATLHLLHYRPSNGSRPTSGPLHSSYLCLQYSPPFLIPALSWFLSIF